MCNDGAHSGSASGDGVYSLKKVIQKYILLSMVVTRIGFNEKVLLLKD